MGKNRVSRGKVTVLPDIIETYRQVSRCNLPPGDQGRGGSYHHKIGECEPAIRSEMRDTGPCSWVSKGTGNVIVIVQLFLVRAGGQGVSSMHTDESGVMMTHYEYWIAPEAVPIANSHENEHSKAIQRQYERLIVPLLDRIEEYREPKVMKTSPGKTQADCRRQLERYIDWKNTLSEYRLACDERDKTLDKEVGTRFGTVHGLRDVTETESTDHLVVPYPVPARWLIQRPPVQ